MKNNILKKILIALHGLFQGFIGLWWSFVGIAFITHPDSSPGTKDWEEDKDFIPVGYIMILIYLIILAVSFYIFKKRNQISLHLLYRLLSVSQAL